MWNINLINNKIYSALLVVMGLMSVSLTGDVTFFIFTLLVGVALFFDKKNRIWEKDGDISDE